MPNFTKIGSAFSMLDEHADTTAVELMSAANLIDVLQECERAWKKKIKTTTVRKNAMSYIPGRVLEIPEAMFAHLQEASYLTPVLTVFLRSVRKVAKSYC